MNAGAMNRIRTGCAACTEQYDEKGETWRGK